jgi:hypothetical protein
MYKKSTKRYQLCVEKIENLEDVKKILDAMHVRIDSDNPLYSEVEQYFTIEVIPKGYLKLLEIISQEELKLMSQEEIEIKCAALLEEGESKQNKNN